MDGWKEGRMEGRKKKKVERERVVVIITSDVY